MTQKVNAPGGSDQNRHAGRAQTSVKFTEREYVPGRERGKGYPFPLLCCSIRPVELTTQRVPVRLGIRNARDAGGGHEGQEEHFHCIGPPEPGSNVHHHGTHLI